MKTYRYRLNDVIENMYAEYMSFKHDKLSFDDWCNSTQGKVHLAELILNDIDEMGGVTSVLSSRT